MSTQTPPEAPAEVEYPESDGQPIAENTLQFEWIVTIQGGLDALFRDDPDVFVAGDLLWYPIEGDNKTRFAPDAMVAFGRPKGYRGSYMQWREGGIAPQVVFEVLSPGNTRDEMDRRRDWYFRLGVEEYYEFDPDHVRLRGWIRDRGGPREVLPMSGWVSPRLGIWFELADDLTIHGPDGRPFSTFVEAIRERDETRQRAEEERLLAETALQHAVEARQHADEARQHAREARQHAEEERLRTKEAQQHAVEARRHAEEARRHADEERNRTEGERQRADEASRRAERLAAQLRALGIEPEG